MLRMAISQISKTIIIIDGLDECDDGARRALCDFLLDCIGFDSVHVKIFVTSRKDTKAVERLRTFPRIDMNATVVCEDIKAYIAAEIQLRIEEETITCKDKELQVKLVQTLNDKADGM